MNLQERLALMPPYAGYLYAYPHKTAYRAFDPPLDFETVWDGEKQDNLFLYLHIPFCEMRCGFCNLFTMTGAKETSVKAFMAALRREAETVRNALPNAQFSQVAIGGGTPTFLDVDGLNDLFSIAGVLAPSGLPLSIETSPSRASKERLALLEHHGVTRISMGVESFSAGALKSMGRPARAEDASVALADVRDLTRAALNIDLIYGALGQTVEGFVDDINRALEWKPEEVFLYPLYVGPLTGLSKREDRHVAWDKQRLSQYRAGRNRLLSTGYEQFSMRRFVKPADGEVLDYSCQDDGMIGLGAGARSYTRSVHYSSDYAVQRGAIKGIIDGYSACEDFSKIYHGVVLSREEQTRRYVIKSILNREGLSLVNYEARFGYSVYADLPEIEVLLEAAYLDEQDGVIVPTELGFERADAMGPFLVSSAVQSTMAAYQWA